MIAWNFVPKRDLVGYCQSNTRFFVKREQSPPAEGAASFHTTRWTIVMQAAQSQVQGGPAALAELCRLYWYPLYVFFPAARTFAGRRPRFNPRFFPAPVGTSGAYER